jgi:hypothetical protein
MRRAIRPGLLSALVGMARFFFVVIVAGTIVLIGALVFVAFTL